MIYVLTKTYDDYNQYGDYFVHAWTSLPTIAQISQAMDSECSEEEYMAIVNDDDSIPTWYKLVRVKN